jgi:hypothetical protein
MKISFVLHPSRPLTPAETKACFAANLAVPGSGSLVAGRAVGYFQMGFYLLGFVISILGAANVFRWYLANPDLLNQPTSDNPFGGLEGLWSVMRWAILGIGFCVFGLSWALVTSFQIMKANPKNPVPPRII